MTVRQGAHDYGIRPEWRVLEQPPALAAGEAHVWSLPLEASDELLRQMLPLLTAAEQRQAYRFVRPELTRRFITRRALLRQLLAAYAAVPPDQLLYGSNNFGKPFLLSPPHAGSVRFNTSQSHEAALLAVVRDREIGVDVERVRPMSDFRQLGRRFFTAAEQLSIEKHPAGEQLQAFFWVWTGKEAILKACGIGISTGLQRGIVAVGERGPELIELDPALGSVSQWRLVALQPTPGYVAALAIDSEIHSLRYLQFQLPAAGDLLPPTARARKR